MEGYTYQGSNALNVRKEHSLALTGAHRPPDKSAGTTVNAESIGRNEQTDMTRNLGTVQQQQDKQMPSADAAVGLEGGGIDGADARQQNSEFRVGVRLHSRGCRWPDNTTSSEMRAWSEGFWVSLVVAFGAPSIGQVPGRGGASLFCVSSSLCLRFDRASERGSAMHVFDTLLLHFRLHLLIKMPEFRRTELQHKYSSSSTRTAAYHTYLYSYKSAKRMFLSQQSDFSGTAGHIIQTLARCEGTLQLCL